MKKSIFIFISLIVQLTISHATTATDLPVTEIGPSISVKSKSKIIPVNEKAEYFSNFELRNDRKLGAGVGLLGVFGYLGGVVDINFDEENSGQTSFGRGYGYNTFFAGWKRSFVGQYFTPYFTLGYSRFYNSVAQDIRGNSYIVDQVISADEAQRGPFGIDFFNAHVGMQYNQLSGDFIGNSFYIEFDVLFSLNRSLIIPTASLGSIYYF